MSEARALTNLIGNGVATLVVSKWCGELDMVQLDKELSLGAQQSTSESSPQSTSATAEVQHG